MSRPKYEQPVVGAESASASVLEREQRQHEALITVQGISRATGRALQVFAGAELAFSGAPGLYMLDAEIAQRGPGKDSKFTFEQRMLSGAADSAHAVIAGQLAVTHQDGRRSDAEVVAKCYQKRALEERLIRARREVEVMRDMAARGEIALEPVAV